MCDFSKATDTEKYFNEIIGQLNGSKIVNVYILTTLWFNEGRFIYEQDTPIYIVFDNGKCLVIEYYDINKLSVEYKEFTETMRNAHMMDAFNRTTVIHDGQTHKAIRMEKSALPYDSLGRVEIKRVTKEYSAWINGGIVDGIKPAEQTFDEIKFVMQNGKSFTLCPDDPEMDGYCLLWSEDATEQIKYPIRYFD